MNYDPNIINFNNAIEIIKEEVNKTRFNKVIMGIGVYNQDSNDVIDKIYLSYLYGFSGVSLFSYDNKKNEFDWYNEIMESLNNIK